MPTPHDDTEIILLLNAICDRFESALKSGDAPSIEQVLADNESTFARESESTDLKRELFLLAFNYSGDKNALANDLRQRFPSDAELVTQLLNSSFTANDQDTATAGMVAESDTMVGDDSLRGNQIGTYQLLKKIGAGGMGDVWLAERHEPYQKVALKLIQRDRLGESTGLKEFTARFEAEREALAMMSHPNIAKILDGGTTDENQPYFVMEFVEGVTLMKYCDQHRLSIAERLKIFVDMCRAVSHAHQKGIIHRDLKPGNIIVAEVDGKPVPKVIDFGLAKATQQTMKLTDKTIQTQVGQAMGTWQYMSPEQAGAQGTGVDIRTDIFALGAILHELLVGTPPLSKQNIEERLDGKDPYLHHLELALLVREFEARRPSSRLSSLKQESTVVASGKTNPSMVDSVSENRAITTSKLESVLTGELDWVVLKATSREPERRYQTAFDLANEIQRFLDGDAVEARPPSTTYRLRKFVRRNKGLVASVATIALTLLAASVASTVFAFRAEMARENEEKQKNQAVKNLEFAKQGNKILGNIFADLDPEQQYQTAADLRNALQTSVSSAVKKLDASELADPLEVVDLQVTLAKSLSNLGAQQQALDLYEKSYNTRKELLGPDDPLVIAIQASVANEKVKLGDYESAITALQDCVERAKRTAGIENKLSIRTSLKLGTAYLGAGKIKLANDCMTEALDRARVHQADDKRLEADLLRALSTCSRRLGKTSLARDQIQSSYQILKATYSEAHPVTIDALGMFANATFGARDKQEAIELCEKAINLSKTHQGDFNPKTLELMGNLGVMYSNINPERSKSIIEEVYRAKATKLGIDHPVTLFSMDNLAAIHRILGEYEQARKVAQRCYDLTLEKFGAENRTTLSRRVGVVRILIAEKNFEGAIEVLPEIVKLLESTLGDDDKFTLQTMDLLAESYRDSGHLDEAIETFTTSHQRFCDSLGADNPESLITAAMLAETLKKAGRFDEAITLLNDTVEKWESTVGREHYECQQIVYRLGQVYFAAGQLKESVGYLREAADSSKKYPRLAPAQKTYRGVLIAAKYADEFNELAKVELLQAREQHAAESAELASALSTLALDYLKVGGPQHAETIMQESLKIRRQLNPEAWNTAFAELMLGKALMDQGEFEKAEPLLTSGYETLVEKAEEIPVVARAIRMNEAIDWMIDFAELTKDEKLMGVLQEEKKKWQESKETSSKKK